MQSNSNRPVYIVQPSNITHLNVRPTIITTSGQQVQTQQQPIYQISTVRQPTIPQQQPTVYQVPSQPRLVTSSPVYATLQPQRFSTSPQQILTTNKNLSPRPLTPQSAPRMSIVASQPTTTIVRPSLTTVSTSPKVTSTPSLTPPMATSALTSTSTSPQTAASTSKDFSVKVPKTRAQYGIMEFANGLSVDVKDWKAIEMRREINPYTYRPATNIDPNAASNSSSITTSLGVVLPKTGAGSEYGREQKEALKRKRYTARGTNIEDLPWVLTDRSSTEKKLKHYRGLKKGGVTTNSSYYVFIQGKDGFEAYPVEDWYGFTPTNVYKTLDFDEAEKQYQERHKHLSKWFLKHQVTKEKDTEDSVENDDEKGKKSTNKNKRSFKLLDTEDWINENEEEEDEDDEREDNDDNNNDKSNKKSKTNKKNNKKPKDAWTLSDDDENETPQPKTKKKKTTQRQTSEDREDSDDGDHECDEIDYTSDDTSEEEDDVKDRDTDKTSTKYEVKGIDEEMRTMPDIEKKLEQMDENADELDFEDDDEEIPDIEENDEENGKTAADDLSDVSKLLKSDAVSKEMESSSDDDDLDDSDDPDKEPIESVTSSMNTQPNPSEQIKTEKGHKKAREEEMRAIKSKVMSLPSTPSNPSETITEDKVRSLLLRKQYMTFTALIQNFLPKAENLRTKEIKESIVQKLATILKRLNIEEKMINNKKHIKLKT
ncbi:unnamed protein product [Rotaria sordida]|uniref:Transcription initiation factor IIF subunit alpha n=1 Tax=Rotaria sordida TaxID=392033 RepID=A0A814XQN4_9BILA|nr:unnamed protein product [Rotaria sordida]CAF1219101.1 unnamed protein product [Rotaria sordida]CAF1425235.1 unnamed protein product [Rotaria sordida]CAF3936894.1 unnamed protein product [Rotaria sordida]